MKMHEYEYIKEEYDDNQYSIQLLNHKFHDFKVVFGKVMFKEEDNFTLKFEYDIIEAGRILTAEDKEEFEHVLGELLVQLMQEGIRDNDLTYTGGVDED
jgi:hypothetical protein